MNRLVYSQIDMLIAKLLYDIDLEDLIKFYSFLSNQKMTIQSNI